MIAIIIAAVVGVCVACVRASILPWVSPMSAYVFVPIVIAANLAAGTRASLVIVGTFAATIGTAYLHGDSVFAALCMTAAAWVAAVPVLRERSRLPLRTAVISALAIAASELGTSSMHLPEWAWLPIVQMIAVAVSAISIAAWGARRCRPRRYEYS